MITRMDVPEMVGPQGISPKLFGRERHSLELPKRPRLRLRNSGAAIQISIVHTLLRGTTQQEM
jgi:hypothetical protein